MKAKKAFPASVPFESVLDEHLKGASKKELIAYLNACLGESDDGDLEGFFEGLQDICRAKGIKALAEKTNVTRDAYYKMFKQKNPTLDTFRSVLHGLGLGFQIIDQSSKHR